MRTIFDKSTGKYVGNLADDRAMDDPTLPAAMFGQIAIDGEWNAEYCRNPATGSVEIDPTYSVPVARDFQAEIDALKARVAQLLQNQQTP